MKLRIADNQSRDCPYDMRAFMYKTDCIEITMQQFLFWIKTSLRQANKMNKRFDKPKTLNVRGKLGPFVKMVYQMQMYNN